MVYLKLFAILLIIKCVCGQFESSNSIQYRYKSDQFISQDDDFPYIGCLHKYFETGFEFSCSLALIRPLWLIGSISQCKLMLYHLENKAKISDVENMIVILHKNFRKIKSLTFPDDVENDIVITELLNDYPDKYLVVPSLELRHLDRNKHISCFSVDYKLEDRHSLIFAEQKIVELMNCKKSEDSKMRHKWICTEKSRENKSMSGPLFCNTGDYSVDVFGFKLEAVENNELWFRLSSYRLYIEKVVDAIIKDIFDFPYFGYMNNTRHNNTLCTLVIIKPNWLLGSTTDCKLQNLATSLPTKVNWTNWVVTVHSRGKKHQRTVRKMIFDEDYDETTLKNDMVFVQVQTFLNGSFLFYTINIGNCYTEYVGCHYIFWIFESSEWGLCSAHTSIHHRTSCPAEDLNLRLKDNAICAKKTNTSKTINSFVLVCDQLDGNYDFIGIKSIDYKGGTNSKLKKKKERWMSLIQQKKFIYSKIKPKPEGVVSKLESVAVLEFKNIKQCTVAFLKYDSDQQIMWHTSSVFQCNLLKSFNEKVNGISQDWSNYRVITPFGEKALVEDMRFHVTTGSENTIVLIKSKLKHPSKNHVTSYQLIPDSRPESHCVRIYASYNESSKSYIYQSELNTLTENKAICKIPVQKWTVEDTWCCTTIDQEHLNSNNDGPLLCRLSGNYYLIGVRSDNGPGNKWKLWMNLLTFKSWMSETMENEAFEPPQPGPLVKSLPESPEYDFDFGNEINLLPYMVRIVVKKQCSCYGFILQRNWIVTGSQCSLTFHKHMSKHFDKKPTDHITAIEVQTKTHDISLVRYVLYAFLDNFTAAELEKETFAFLRLQWPLIFLPGTVGHIKVFSEGEPNFSPNSNTICQIISPIHRQLARALGYRGKSGHLRKIQMQIVDPSICSNFYQTTSGMPWGFTVCTRTSMAVKEVFFSDFSAGLICNNRLISISADRWNYPTQAIQMKKQGKRVPIGWLRLDSFSNQLKSFNNEDWRFSEDVYYGENVKNGDNIWKCMCSIQYRDHHLMSGVVIGGQYLLSNDDVYSAEQIIGAKDSLAVVCGSVDLKLGDANEEVYEIELAKHVEGDTSLVLILLKQNVSKKITKIPINEDYEIHSKKSKCVAGGWARESTTRWYDRQKFVKNHVLKTGKYKIDFMSGNYIYTKISHREPCLSDIGAALICNGALTGISFWDENCDNKTSIRRKWTNIPKLNIVIKKTMESINKEIVKPAHKVWKKNLLRQLSKPSDDTKQNTQLNNRKNAIVAVLVHHQYTCIGTLIHVRWVLTSAICLYNRKPTDIQIAAGVLNINKLYEYEKFNVAKMSIPYEGCNDIAMVMLSKPVSLSKYSLVDISNQFSNRDCSILNVYNNMSMGWPAKNFENRMIISFGLQSELPVFCSEMFPNRTITYNHMCTSVRNTDTFASFLKYPGGPLFCVPIDKNYILVKGINVWGVGDTWNGKTGVVWSKVDIYWNWITNNLDNTPDKHTNVLTRKVDTLYETKIVYYSNGIRLKFMMNFIFIVIKIINYI